VLVKGADWTPETIVGSDFVKSNGGKVVRISLMPEISTSRIIEKILVLHRQD
jgi:D-beta-D-heptose 7-phosphate kinase/D-beta-D-heptose 1-phosphate adenosyltransferase